MSGLGSLRFVDVVLMASSGHDLCAQGQLVAEGEALCEALCEAPLKVVSYYIQS